MEGRALLLEFKSPYDDGTIHVILSPTEFIGRLVSLVPMPKGYGMSWAQRLKRVLTGRHSIPFQILRVFSLIQHEIRALRERKSANSYSTNVLDSF
ncbi:MAG: hypothetical protein ACI9HA_003909 [Dinoroseobacter sp.]|jgi:hypothetical protein